MIANEGQVWAALQVTGATNKERAIVQQIHRYTESKIKNHLGYDPEQKTYTEFYPRRGEQPIAQQGQAGIWDVNRSHTHARFERVTVGKDSLQLEHIPVRSIASLLVDEGGFFGDGDGAFPAGSAWTIGEDFYVEWDRDSYCRSGLLRARGSWPLESGSVKIVYTAGYSRSELEGTASNGIDASAILGAVVKTVVYQFAEWDAWKKNARSGVAGPLLSERAQDYSYTISQQVSSFLSMNWSLSAEATEDLEEYVHYGLMRV